MIAHSDFDLYSQDEYQLMSVFHVSAGPFKVLRCLNLLSLLKLDYWKIFVIELFALLMDFGYQLIVSCVICKCFPLF